MEKREWRLWWEVEEDDDGVARLQALVPRDFPRDADTMAALTEARHLADNRSGGWRGVYTKGKSPELPWYSGVSPEVHAWLWILLLKLWCVNPDTKAP